MQGNSFSSGPPPINLSPNLKWIQSYSFRTDISSDPGNKIIKELTSFQLFIWSLKNEWNVSFAVPLQFRASSDAELFSGDALRHAYILSYGEKLNSARRWRFVYSIFLPFKQKPLFVLPGFAAIYRSEDSKHMTRLSFPNSFYRYQLKEDLILGASAAWISKQHLRASSSFVTNEKYYELRIVRMAIHLQKRWFKSLFFTASAGLDYSRERLLNDDLNLQQKTGSGFGTFMGVGVAYQFSGRPPRF